ncbi:MAG: FtsX-like permease family protein [Planctomycetes bacterium]|nr:FtsX-like permease family protein [Planctomycetota bacterium]
MSERIVDRDRRHIGKQIVLPLSKAIEIALKSLKIRFWRSIITMGGIILAIAFVMSIWAGNAYVNGFKTLNDENPDKEELRLIMEKKGIEVGEEASLSASQYWLIVLSLLVCVVGIVNAMLMSVSERIREIGTMKCLGALDGFIIKLFLLESSLQGIAGTVFGIIMGFVLSFIGTLFGYGWYDMDTFPYFGFYALTYFPWAGLLQSALLCFVIGSVLSILAAIGPAYSAAKMQPVDAMRSEE